VLYRDLKPENLLIDEQGHVRLIDMGLAVRITKERPRRMSRVGTECYMAPEVRWASKRNQPYGVSADWYTVGVLLYEFSAGDTPYAEPEADKPKFRPHKFPDRETEDFVRRLVEQDCTKRLGCGSKGISEVHNHPFWRDVEWDLVPLRKIASPCKGVKGPRKAKERREAQAAAVEIAGELADVSIDSSAPGDDDRRIDDWEFVSPNAFVEEYMENMFRSLASMDAGMDPGTYRV
jgi:serine/threonine protein kinase